ncbi:MAG TPA: type II toxin-antitoxin system RelE/ParE family toxin [Thermoanaerobaculia bacterium]|nr:type II toxin-antitoxin system RelE/ParE family toxin [Thermoanaerobaculia bacterium]
MPSREVRISRSAERQLGRLPRDDQLRVAREMLALAEEPFPRGARKLVGYDDVYRVRVGRDRVLYSVDDDALIVLVLKIGHRTDVYR